ncbi:MAG: pantetheine-phosphate adenylyltransferase [Muribaculaceae bacterium]|nr:pantetheine-phosphate adenylyltransferase [Muribaculaceae bacterium]MDE7386972.1 pantetheine-phosphate adenylyltransferase [Muribaculaceae bacterium]
MTTAKSRKAIFAGSFDPFTIGHMSVLERVLPLFDHVYIVVGYNNAKKGALTPAERVAAIERLFNNEPRVSVMAWDGLTTDLARQLGADYLIRGVRSAIDFESEQNLATINRTISGIETIFVPTLPEHAAISSSVVRELEHFGHDASQFLPQ